MSVNEELWKKFQEEAMARGLLVSEGRRTWLIVPCSTVWFNIMPNAASVQRLFDLARTDEFAKTSIAQELGALCTDKNDGNSFFSGGFGLNGGTLKDRMRI